MCSVYWNCVGILVQCMWRSIMPALDEIINELLVGADNMIEALSVKPPTITSEIMKCNYEHLAATVAWGQSQVWFGKNVSVEEISQMPLVLPAWPHHWGQVIEWTLIGTKASWSIPTENLSSTSLGISMCLPIEVSVCASHWSFCQNSVWQAIALFYSWQHLLWHLCLVKCT